MSLDSTKLATLRLLTTLSLLPLLPTFVGAQQERVRVAVLDFDTYLVEQGEWQFPWAASGLGPLATSMLTNELASHGRFTVIERRYIDQILAEQDFGASGSVDPSSAARVGQLLGAQVVVVGDVEEFGTKKVGGIGGFARGVVGGSQETMLVSLGARLIDAGTGEILSTSEGAAEVSQGAVGLLTQSVGLVAGSELEGEASKVMREAIDDLAVNIAEQADRLEFKPVVTCLTGTVATVAGGRLYLTLGTGSSVAVGDYFEIRDRLDAIVDPATGDTLGFVEESRGLVQVAEVQERMSIADILEGAAFGAGQAAVRSAGPRDDSPCVSLPNPGDS